MTTSKLLALLLSACLLVLLAGCGGGGGGGSTAILAFVDDGGAAIPGATGFTGSLTGGTLTAPQTLSPDSTGRVNLGLGAGTYTITATFKRTGELITLTANQSITVAAADNMKVHQIRLGDTDLSDGWALYRAGNFDGAIAEFEAYKVRAGAAGFGSNAADCALGWAYGKKRNYSESESHFNGALAANGNNVDALVGLAGIRLVRNSVASDAISAETLMTSAAGATGDYSSAPTHDAIRETDLIISRALAHYFQGDVAAANADLASVKDRVATSASVAGIDLFNMLSLLLRN